MDNKANASVLLSLAAEQLRADVRLPHGTMQSIATVIQNNQLATPGRSGRTKYRRGTVSEILDVLSAALAS